MSSTEGQQFATAFRSIAHVGARTRWYTKARSRFGIQLTREYMLREAFETLHFPGVRSDETAATLRKGFAALNAWVKHVEGYRIDPVLISKLHKLTPWQWTAFLGEMVDSGCTNMGEFEDWFNNMARERATQAA